MKIRVNMSDFTEALNVIHPFTDSTKTKNAEPQQFELIYVNSTHDGKVAISAFRHSRSFACQLIELLGTDGEVCEFAIHRDDVATLTNHFRLKKLKDEDAEPQLEITIRHEDFREPAGNGSKIARATVLDFQEQGVLIHPRELRMNGVDSRPAEVRRHWRIAADTTHTANEDILQRYLRPQDTIVLNKACTLLKNQPLIRMTHQHLLASIGHWFFAVFELTERSTDSADAASFNEWAHVLNDYSQSFPVEQVYLEDAA